VKKVRGSEIAAKSQTLWETRICPFESVWTNWVEKKFLGELTWNHLEPCLQILTATIVVGRYTRVITVKILTAAASFVLLFWDLVRHGDKTIWSGIYRELTH
jgi:hypothetical protein